MSVKLGTITPEGGAGWPSRLWTLFATALLNETRIDIYCYSCNDAKTDPDLALHLANFGINVQTQTKTEKSMTELVS